jgi:hypothetical protein
MPEPHYAAELKYALVDSISRLLSVFRRKGPFRRELFRSMGPPELRMFKSIPPLA